MANKQIFQLDAKATPSLTDVIPLQDAAGSADAKKVTLSAVQSALTGKQDTLGFTPENVANKSTDGTFAANSDVLYPSQKAAKTYSDGLAVGLLRDRGNYDASSNLFPSTGGSGAGGAVKAGDLWYISVAGTLGGTSVLVGYSVRALVDSPAQTSTNWSILNVGLGFVPENVANKSTNVNLGTSNTLYPTQNAVKTYVDANANATLNNVLTNGNTSLLDAKVGTVGLFDAANGDYGKIELSDSQFVFSGVTNDPILGVDGTSSVLNLFPNVGITETINYAGITANRTHTLPDKNGTFAMLDDITTGVESVTGFGVDNTDSSNPIVNKFTKSLNFTATGTNQGTAAPITSVYTRINNGGTNTGVLLPDSTNVGDKYYIYNSTDFTKKVYANVDIYVNSSFLSSVVLLPYTVYSFTYMVGGFITVNQEQVAPYRTYTAIISQGGNNAPNVDILLSNTLSDIPVWSYLSTGVYRLTLAGAFPDGKVFFNPSFPVAYVDGTGAKGYFDINRQSDNIIQMNVLNEALTAPKEAEFFGASILNLEIRVYN